MRRFTLGLFGIGLMIGLAVWTGMADGQSPDPYQRQNTNPPQNAFQPQGPRDGMEANRQQGGPRGQNDANRRGPGQLAGRQGPGGSHQAGARPQGGQQGGGSKNPVILALDINGDRQLSADEIAQAAQSLMKLDVNRDGILSNEEMKPKDKQPGGQGQTVRPQPPQGQGNRNPGGQGHYRPRPDSQRDGSPAIRPPQPASMRPAGPPQSRQDDRYQQGMGPGQGTRLQPNVRPGQNTPPRAAPPSVALPFTGTSKPSQVEGFALIEAGRFEMGDHHDLGGREHRNDEVPVHAVQLDAFYMQKTETTNQQYCDYLNSALLQRLIELRDGKIVQAEAGTDRVNAPTRTVYADTYESDTASQIAMNRERRFVVRPGREDHPVVCIRWHGATAYANWLSAQNGLSPCYDMKTWACDHSKNGYRLPTEAQWEYAGRGGLDDQYRVFPWGDEPDNARANWPGSGDPFETGPYPWTTPVGFYNGELHRKSDCDWPAERETYQTRDGANGYGLYDMSGNVWEWTGDWYNRDYYATGPSVNPTGPDCGTPVADGGTYRVLRSGSWYNGEHGHGRVSNRNPAYYRGPDDPNHRWYHIGFRLALPVSSQKEVAAAARLGVLVNKAEAFKGYTLFAPKHNTMVYLIDNEGRVVNRWDTEYEPGQSVYLLENGHLLHCCFTKNKNFTRGGEGGRLEEYDWDGNLVWEFEYSSDKVLSHHDIAPMPNGNVLILAVEHKSLEQCVAAGFDPRMIRDGQLFPEHVIEVKKTGPKSGEIVWEWHVWDHLIQDFDSSKSNYGKVAEHPERINVHGSLRGIPAFWNHGNSIDYNAKLDQIVLSMRGFNEIWVIDHSTTTVEAASTQGGRQGLGGDLIWRWGNPIAWNGGTIDDRKLFQQHDAQWIPDGYPGAGNLTIFNNGYELGYSSIIEIKPPVDTNGSYANYDAEVVWEYQAANPEDFFSSEISGAHRLPNGNTLICAGVMGEFFEVTSEGETVWMYRNPVIREGILSADGVAGEDHRGHKWNAVFKIHRYPADYPGLVDKDLTPGKVIEQPLGQPMLSTGDPALRRFAPKDGPQGPQPRQPRK